MKNQSARRKRVVTITISGPQGAGKTTLEMALRVLFKHRRVDAPGLLSVVDHMRLNGIAVAVSTTNQE